MGGDASPAEVNALAAHVHAEHPGLKTAWYSGRTVLSYEIDLHNFDYIKLGPYLAHLGALKDRHTNQKFYKVEEGKLVDITSVFWRK